MRCFHLRLSNMIYLFLFFNNSPHSLLISFQADGWVVVFIKAPSLDRLPGNTKELLSAYEVKTCDYSHQPLLNGFVYTISHARLRSTRGRLSSTSKRCCMQRSSPGRYYKKKKTTSSKRFDTEPHGRNANANAITIWSRNRFERITILTFP